MTSFTTSTSRNRWFSAGLAALLALGGGSAANAQLALSSPRPLVVPGFTFGGGNPEDSRVQGAAIDPVTGHLWVVGVAEEWDEESELFEEPGIAEIDLATGNVVSTLGRRYEFDHAASLAIHPTTRHLWIAWLDVVDERPNLSGAMELTESGDVVSFVKISQTGQLLDAIGDWDPALFGPEPGLEVYLPAAAFSPSGKLFWVKGGGPAHRFNPETLRIEETFQFTGGPNTNYASGAFDPVTGHWFVASTDNRLLEMDTLNHTVISLTDLDPFLPPPHPTYGRARVDAFEFDLTGGTIILGGSFGMITAVRTVPEPATIASFGCGLLALGVVSRCRGRRPRRVRA